MLLVDDQALLRMGFRLVLEAEDDLEVVGEASDGREAVEVVLRTAPDIVLMDVRMPRMGGMDLLSTLRAKGNDATVIEEVARLIEPVAQSWELLRGPGPAYLQPVTGRGA